MNVPPRQGGTFINNLRWLYCEITLTESLPAPGIHHTQAPRWKAPNQRSSFLSRSNFSLAYVLPDYVYVTHCYISHRFTHKP